MATIKGVWVFNDTPQGIGLASNTETYNINFTSNSVNYSKLTFAEGNLLRLTIKYGDTTVCSNGAWVDDAYKIVNFGNTEQTIDDMAYVTANATEQKAEPTVSFDLTSLDLGEGTHNITVVGKADGYKNSVESAGVQFTVELPQLDPAVISLDGDILSITDESGLASTATIYVDGEAKQTVEMSKIPILMVNASRTANTGTVYKTCIKFDTAPTSESDYDIIVSGDTPSSEVMGTFEASKAYIFAPANTYASGYYSIVYADGATVSKTSVRYGYSNATELTFEQNATITLYSDYTAGGAN